MTEQPDNLVLRYLQEMRAETTARDEKLQAQIGTLAEAAVRQSKRFDAIDEHLQNFGKRLDSLTNAVHTISLAVDHHSARLDNIEQRIDRIERHLGLDAQKH
jgi:chromosome segregation ATPase